MGIWIGIDGGGTKTKFLAVSENGERLRSHISGGTYYHAVGIEAVCSRLLEGISAVKSTEDVLGICFGMPGFGEGDAADTEAAARIRAAMDVPAAFQPPLLDPAEGAVLLAAERYPPLRDVSRLRKALMEHGSCAP